LIVMSFGALLLIVFKRLLPQSVYADQQLYLSQPI
jgi:hypothetical protein